jgi:uncharacterized membrane protein (DUF373 family)
MQVTDNLIYQVSYLLRIIILVGLLITVRTIFLLFGSSNKLGVLELVALGLFIIATGLIFILIKHVKQMSRTKSNLKGRVGAKTVFTKALLESLAEVFFLS